MATDKQIEANRRNAQKSTGPTSVPGKAAASMNALKTGIHAKSVIIPGEKPAELQHLIDEYYAHYRPADPTARSLVDDLIRCEWTLRRLDTSEASLWNYQIADSFRPVPDEHKQGKIATQAMKPLAAIQRRIDSTRRGRDRALEALNKQLKEPLPAADPAPPPALTLCPPVVSPEIGFVPSTPSQVPSAPETDTQSQPEENPEVVLS